MSKPPKRSSKRVQDPKEYREGLGPKEKGRYLEKLAFVGGADPYQLACSTWIRDDPVILPSVGYPDIVTRFSRGAHIQRKTLKPTKVWSPLTRWCVDGWGRGRTKLLTTVVLKAKVSNATTSLINLTYSKCFSLVCPIGTNWNTAIINHFPWRRSGYTSVPVLCCDAEYLQHGRLPVWWRAVKTLYTQMWQPSCTLEASSLHWLNKYSTKLAKGFLRIHLNSPLWTFHSPFCSEPLHWASESSQWQYVLRRAGPGTLSLMQPGSE